MTFDGKPEPVVLAPVVGAEGDEDGVRAAGDVQSSRQVPAACQRLLGVVVDDEHVGVAAGRPLERHVGGGTHQQTLIAPRHDTADARRAGRVAAREAGAGDERRTVGHPPSRRAHIRRLASYTYHVQHNIPYTYD